MLLRVGSQLLELTVMDNREEGMHLRSEDIYPGEIAVYGHMMIGMMQLRVRDTAFGGTTLGAIRHRTRELFNCMELRAEIQIRIDRFPADYDPLI